MGFSETKTELFQADAENSGLMISLRSMIVIILSMTTPLAYSVTVMIRCIIKYTVLGIPPRNSPGCREHLIHEHSNSFN